MRYNLGKIEVIDCFISTLLCRYLWFVDNMPRIFLKLSVLFFQGLASVLSQFHQGAFHVLRPKDLRLELGSFFSIHRGN